ncbi:MAG: FAD-dependent oxidoreductase [Phycisphaerae bacterium]|nr:FAD-dependent oxidoreductase [Phycisphaerae bacterium]
MTRRERVAKVNDLREGEMREVTVGERRILLARINGEYRATSGTCNHHGAPLAEGLLIGHHVRCPWHHSRFNLLTGDLEVSPALDALAVFDVGIEGDDVMVELPEGESPEHRHMPMAEYDPQADPRTFVILGTGSAGGAAAEMLRQKGFRGRVIMVTHENFLPYDRPPLSKNYLRSWEDTSPPLLRDEEFYREFTIDVKTGRRVVQVDTTAKEVIFEDKSFIGYDRLLIATGGVPRQLETPGVGLKRIFTLRSLADCNRIRETIRESQRAVVVGASFIGMETAACMRERGLEVTVVAPDRVPFEKQLGEPIGRMYQQLHEEKGVTFRLGRQVARFEGDDRVRAAVLDDGERLEADMVVVGIGVRPATEFLRGVDRNDDGSVNVDEHFQVINDVYAAGDVACFPDWRTGERTRIEHWCVAEEQGRVAASNMADVEAEYRTSPFFWTNQYRVIFQYVGHAGRWDDIVIDGDVSQRTFVAWYIKDGRVLAVGGCNESMKIMAAAELMLVDQLPSPDEARAGVDLVAMARDIRVHA